ncbi:MAG: c-type cytochrome [Planctomycetes bacterium]|nr:c-type cytochrome [Planctomycetota bacterium]MCB9936275.1 c-type cytochrome [Planctomycetota bacterium]
MQPRTAILFLLALAAVACLWAGCVKSADPAAENNHPNRPVADSRPEETPGLPTTDDELAAEAEGIIARRACRGCHRPDDGSDTASAANLAPPLARIAERRPGDWLRRFLRYPYTIRPHQPERMPRLGLDDREVEVLARYLEWLARERISLLPAVGPAREAKPRHPRLLNARRLLVKYNCMNCHSLGKHQIRIQRDEQGNVVFQHGALQAPDLTKVWQRVRPQWLVAMIQHPPDWMPWSRMPELNVTEQDVQDLAWYLLNAEPSPATRVTAPDVEALLKDRCAGCHNVDDPARGLDLSSSSGMRRGVLDDCGGRYPAVVPFAENSPLLGRLARGDADHTLRAEDMARLREWILAGAPGLAD